ncbi:uncharacterized protein with FMN-binding domain [Anaerobacterium chartisolvens]|uniref:Uncharacterized protein with FMN-binding domain n=1 Tax=Anaerobacterium chartisolvens TaxID=1297424 RepID=A0A369AHR0_9FIRM|nr:FMN-binding protein [Anaerobacterium chartisolvens]RCX08892.1 uncharacterized protein with FMN-binding domain [Anaerobacterium chartisolvens]
MKKITVVTAIVILVFTLGGCSPQNNENQQTTTQEGNGQQTTTQEPPAQGAYKDGTYEGAADPWQYGAENATVEVADGKIKSIILRRLDTDGKEVDYENWKGQEIEGKLYPNLKQYRIDMADAMVQKQSYDVDIISGATTSCNNWKISVQKALEKAK